VSPGLLKLHTSKERIVAYDTTELLGTKQLAGAVVLPRGWTMQHGVSRAGLAGEAIAFTARKKAKPKPNTSQTPQFGRSTYLAVTHQEVALLTPRSKSPGRLGEVLARVPRTEVASAKLSPGAAFLRTNVTIGFTNGSTWEFEQSPLVRPVLVKIIRALGF
jgi:hypothetical protein